MTTRPGGAAGLGGAQSPVTAWLGLGPWTEGCALDKRGEFWESSSVF